MCRSRLPLLKQEGNLFQKNKSIAGDTISEPGSIKTSCKELPRGQMDKEIQRATSPSYLQLPSVLSAFDIAFQQIQRKLAPLLKVNEK